MSVFWKGEPQKTERGVVADHCRTCGELAAITIAELDEATDSSFLTGDVTIGTCVNCGAEARCETGRYVRLIPVIDAKSLTVRQILERTNPRLLSLVERRERLQALVRNGEPVPQDEHRDVVTAEMDVEGVFEGSNELRQRFEEWERLDEGERAQLLFDSEAAIALIRALRRALVLLRSVSREFNDSSALATALTLTLVVVAVLVISYEAGVVWGFVLGFVVLAGARALRAGISRDAVKAWTRKKLEPRLTEGEHDVRLLVTILYSVDPEDEEIEDKLRDLAREIDTIAATLLEDGYLVLPAGEPQDEKGIFDG